MLETGRGRITLLIGTMFLLAVILGTQWLKTEVRLDRLKKKDWRLAETSYMPPNEVLRLLALGHEAFYADVIFINAQQYFYNHLVRDRKYHWLDVYLDGITGYCRGSDGEKLALTPSQCRETEAATWIAGLFPFNPRVYLWGAQIVKFAPMITDELIDKAVLFDKTGIEFCPDDWNLYFDLGFNLFFEYRDLPQEEMEAHKSEGLKYIGIASKLPGAAVDPNFVVSNLWSRAETQRALQMIYLTYYNAGDRERSEMRMRTNAYGESELASLYKAEEELWQKEMPYVPLHFYHTLGRTVQVNTEPDKQ